MKGTCPTCGQKLPGTQRRICADCSLPILSHHRYYFDGSTVRHRDCGDPRLERDVVEREAQRELLGAE